MTNDEFKDWFERHCAFFPGIKTWLNKQEDDHRQMIFRAWRELLVSFEFDTAREASKRLYGAEQTTPYERHAAVIRRLCSEMSKGVDTPANRRHREGTYECKWCLDSGYVSIYACGTWLANCIKLYGEDLGMKQTGTVACTCHRGDRVTSRTRFDPERMIVARRSWREEEMRGDRPEIFDKDGRLYMVKHEGKEAV
ncbi:hypothetical protein Pan216_21180 [Planctomycetes bacterium Pan216]|uniref:Uncharacterized protein n=1 Tax=Kolteria novifilia TaxID=2527975 RepID=A0A518B2V0_9BACT|nr:hypothetical protein Pan216_21180 [Planctomycetes bacterium Pan216]